MALKNTVLIVDDNSNNLNIAAHTLIQEDINIMLASNGKKALQLADAYLPNLILLDVMMPEMDGFEVCRQLKDSESTKNIPVIFLTALGKTANIIKAFELGAVDYVNKPFIASELIARVSAHLKLYELNNELTLRNIELKAKNEELNASIRYAHIIQNALLPSDMQLQGIFKNYFVFYSPKEIVSGDFYYLNKIGQKLVFAVADSTGHGVPGGFLSMLGISFLNRIFEKTKKLTPALVLDELREQIKGAFRDTNAESNGMDIALCFLDLENNIIEFSGANIALYLVREKQITVFKSTRNPIGFYMHEQAFENKIVHLQKNDAIYLFTDGYADQFGGQNDKKFKISSLKKMIIEIAELDMFIQKQIFIEKFNRWKDERLQTDDILIFGLKIER